MSFSESVSFHSASIFVFVSIFIFSLYEYQNLYLYECYCRMWSDCKKPLTESVLFHSAFSEYLSSKRQVHDNTECKSREHRLWKYKKVHYRYKYIFLYLYCTFNMNFQNIRLPTYKYISQNIQKICNVNTILSMVVATYIKCGLQFSVQCSVGQHCISVSYSCL